jgi:hypothetical protein
MRITWFALLTVVFFGACSNLRAQAPDANAQSDPQAVQILEKALSAMEGGKLTALVDIRLEGTMALLSSPDLAFGTFVAKVRGEDWSMETTRDATRTSYRILKGTGSMRRDESNMPLQSKSTVGLRLDILPILGRWIEFNEQGSVAQIAGTVVLDGISCYELHMRSGRSETNPLRMNSNGSVDVFVDVTTGLVIAIRYQTPVSSGKGLILVENRYAQYQHVGGVLVPTKVTHYIGGKPLATYRITAVQTNNGFTDDDFRN